MTKVRIGKQRIKNAQNQENEQLTCCPTNLAWQVISILTTVSSGLVTGLRPLVTGNSLDPPSPQLGFRVQGFLGNHWPPSGYLVHNLFAVWYYIGLSEMGVKHSLCTYSTLHWKPKWNNLQVRTIRNPHNLSTVGYSFNPDI